MHNSELTGGGLIANPFRKAQLYSYCNGIQNRIIIDERVVSDGNFMGMAESDVVAESHASTDFMDQKWIKYLSQKYPDSPRNPGKKEYYELILEEGPRAPFPHK